MKYKDIVIIKTKPGYEEVDESNINVLEKYLSKNYKIINSQNNGRGIIIYILEGEIDNKNK
jgi:hypothetical protein